MHVCICVCVCFHVWVRAWDCHSFNYHVLGCQEARYISGALLHKHQKVPFELLEQQYTESALPSRRCPGHVKVE